MAQQSSERACDRCRERRVKCDKRQPTCLRCDKLGKPCPGYDKKRKFVDEGVSLRRKFQLPAGEIGQSSQYISFETPTQSSTSGTLDGLRSPQATSSIEGRHAPNSSTNDTYLPDAPNLGHPRLGTAANIIGSNPELSGPIELGRSTVAPEAPTLRRLRDPVLFPEADYALQGLEDPALEVWNDTTFDPAWFNLDPDAYYAQNNNSCGFIPNAHIVDEVDRRNLQQSTEPSSVTPMSTAVTSFPDSTLWASESQLHTSAIINDEREHEMAYLIRHFTETIGPWMDLFDKDKHFEHLVPLKALRDALLRNAVAAVAAKQLGRVHGNKPFLGNQCQKPAHMEVIDNREVDWYYKAANYYDKAIAFSRVYLQAVSGSLSRPPSPNTQEDLALANSDDLLVAVSIFSLYESLDNAELGWVSHLAGLKSLLTAVSPHQQEQHQLVPAITVGRKASFWNFARADYQDAYVHRRKTLLDTEDLQLWRDCGLQVQKDGPLYNDPDKVKNDPLHCRKISQLCSRTLLWIVLRVTNYVATSEGCNEGPHTRQQTWTQLSSLLDSWYGNLPETFQPCAQIRYPLRLRSHRGSSSHLTEVFFSITVCAAALQLYHFARIVLLLNKPGTMSGTSRLKAYREVSAEAIKHARQIVGIALGRPPPSVRVEMSLPLYVAGGCLEDDDERKVVLDLLNAIEQDTGCPNDIKVRTLMDEWNWKQEPAGID